MKRLFVLAAGGLLYANAFATVFVTVPATQVLTGSSSNIPAGVYLRVSGQIGSASCYYPGFNTSMFYVNPKNSLVDAKMALALMTTAHVTSHNLELVVNEVSTSTDFGNYGITSCEVTGLVLD